MRSAESSTMSPKKAPKFIAYYRVSTAKQGASGLGLEAQREAVRAYLHSQGNGEPLAEYVEVESGKNDERPLLLKALADCRARRAVLVIAKIDRLARSVEFLARLMNGDVEFVACDNPHATKFTVHILAALAEKEREDISARTKAAIAARTARGLEWNATAKRYLKPGEPISAARATAASVAKAKMTAEGLRPYIEAARSAGCSGLQSLADYLTKEGVPTPRGGERWTATGVRRVMLYIEVQ